MTNSEAPDKEATANQAETQSAGGKCSKCRIAVFIVLALVALGAFGVYRFIFADPNADERPEVVEVNMDELQRKLHAAFQGKAHPIDPALKLAEEVRQYIRENITDMTCEMTKQEMIGDETQPEQKMFCKLRLRKEKDGKVTTPLSVYLRFIDPKKGREVIWIEGANDNKLVAHEAGFLNVLSVWLKPDAPLAMRGQRYPISEVGVENLVVQLIVRGLREREHDEGEMTIDEDTEFNGKSCTMIELRHPQKSDKFDFFYARIYMDNELRIPVHYTAYDWPENPGEEPKIIESYTYTSIKLNVGLTDEDFNHENPEYNFP